MHPTLNFTIESPQNYSSSLAAIQVLSEFFSRGVKTPITISSSTESSTALPIVPCKRSAGNNRITRATHNSRGKGDNPPCERLK